MATLSEQERKRIQRYCIYPKIAGAALAMAFVLPFLIIPFEMIDDIVFHHEGFQETGMMTALVLTAIELVIFCYCTLAPRFGMRGKQWKEMQRRLVVEQTEKDSSAQIAGVVGTQAAARLLKNSDNETARNLGGAAEVAAAVGAVATAADVLTESFANAKAMAEACGLPTPRAKSGSSRLWRCPSQSYAVPISRSWRRETPRCRRTPRPRPSRSPSPARR